MKMRLSYHLAGVPRRESQYGDELEMLDDLEEEGNNIRAGV